MKTWNYQGNECRIDIRTQTVAAGIGGATQQEKVVDVFVNGLRWERRCHRSAPLSITEDEVAEKVNGDIDMRLAAGQQMPGYKEPGERGNA